MTNEGLGWDPEPKKYNNPGGDDCILGRGTTQPITIGIPKLSIIPTNIKKLAVWVGERRKCVGAPIHPTNHLQQKKSELRLRWCFWH